MNNALFYGTPLVLEIHPMSASLSPEIRRFQRRGEPYPVYYAPEMAMRAHDYRYLLRLISDRIALLAPERFSLLPQFRSLDPSAAH
jgi:hypothetical protein